MQIVSVRARPGRVAFLDGFCQKQIPHGRPIRTFMTPLLSRLINVHGDVEIVPDENPAELEATVAETRRRGRPRKQGAD